MKRNVKKLASLILALAMVMSLAVTGFAADGVAPTNFTDNKAAFTATDFTGAPVDLAEAVITYENDTTNGPQNFAIADPSGWTVSLNGDMDKLTVTDGTTSFDISVALDYDKLGSNFTDGALTLNGTKATVEQGGGQQGGGQQGGGQQGGGQQGQPETPTYVGSATVTKNEFGGANDVTVKSVDTEDPALNGKTITLKWNQTTGAIDVTTDSAYTVDSSGVDSSKIGAANDNTVILKDGTDTKATVVLSFTASAQPESDGKEIVVTLKVVADGSLTSLGSSGKATGTVTNEGKIPDNVINVTVPTANTSKNTFDMYLDPHNLLSQSGGARYAKNTGDTVALTGGANVYFKNGDNTFSNVSNELKITNKSNVRVAATLSVEATKDDNKPFTFVDTADAVGATTNAAAMYLAITAGDSTQAVSNTAAGGKNVGSISKNIATGDWYKVTWDGAKYAYSEKTGNTYEEITFKLTAKINDNAAWDLVDTFPLEVVWSIASATAETPVAPTATVKTKWAGASTADTQSNLVLTLNFGTLTAAKQKATFTTNNSSVTATVEKGATEMTIAAPTAVFQYNQLNTFKVTFYDSAIDETGAVVVEFTAADVKA